MPTIHSANADLPRLSEAFGGPQYVHPAVRHRGRIPMAFQVTSPFDRTRCLLPHALVLHVNPSSLQITHNKQIERIQTRGGWVEQHWPDQLDEVSCTGSTGAFMNIHTGLTSVLRQRTIAWDRFRDLHDLYRNNGSVHDPSGNIVLQGQVMLLFDMGVYTGTFRTFQFEETAESPFAFTFNWAFVVEHILVQFPYAGSGAPLWGPRARVPAFQGQNALEAPYSAAQQREQAAHVEEVESEEDGLRSAIASGIAAGKEFVKDLFGQYSSRQAQEQADLRREREAQMRGATGYDPNYDRERQRQEMGLPPTTGIPISSEFSRQAQEQADLRREREAQMRGATGYDPNYDRERQRQEMGLPPTRNP